MEINWITIVLAVVTIGLAIGFGIWQRYRASEAQRNNERSAMTSGKANTKL